MVTCKESTFSVDERLLELASGDETLFQAARYALFSGGKRLRPRIVLAVCDAYDVPRSAGLDVACAIEMIHTYSLIHDDLPCMDDDDFRRGKPTLHKVHSPAIAVLTGDFLLTYAFEVVADQSEIVKVLARASGAHGMVGGQVMDIEGSIDLKTTHQKKTGALISAAFECGAIVAKTSDRELLKRVGFDLGYAFQIVDDVLDGDLDASWTEEALRIKAAAESDLRSIAGDPSPLLELAEKMVVRHV